MRRISLHVDEPLLVVSTDYHERIRLILKSFRGARWDGQARVWHLPLEHRDGLLEQLAPFAFEVDAEVRALELAEEPERDNEGDATLTVRQVNYRIGSAVLKQFPERLWVRGEVAGFDKGARRKHWYFELVEKSEQGDDVAARLPIVVFQTRRQRIERRLAEAAEPLTLRDGLEVRVCGRLEYYSAGGRLQLLVDDIDPDFAFGQLARRRREILRQVEAEGLGNLNAARPWPLLPLRIGLITAASSDALHDVLETFQQSHYGFRVLHVPAAVQGAQLEPEMLAALELFERHPEAVDLVLIVRGGGARSDLAWFDNLSLARAIARHPCKVLLGIGHERDRLVLDAVAHAEKTPTAAAEAVVGMVAWAEDQLDRLARGLAERTRRRLVLEHERNHRQGARLLAVSRSALRRGRQQIERELAPGLRLSVRSRLTVERARMGALGARLQPERLERALLRESERRDQRRDRLERAARAGLERLEQRLEVVAARLSAADPKHALARGFAIVHNADGVVVRRPEDAAVGSTVTATLYQGRLLAEVTAHGSGKEGT